MAIDSSSAGIVLVLRSGGAVIDIKTHVVTSQRGFILMQQGN
jgi:hypothetical protein